MKGIRFWICIFFLPVLFFVTMREMLLNKGWSVHFWWKRNLGIPDLQDYLNHEVAVVQAK